MNKKIISFTLITLTACTNNLTERHIQCDSTTATIAFNELTMNVTIDNKNYQLGKVVSASGMKYQNQSALVWLKGNDAIITFANTKLNNCKVIDIP